MSKFFKKPFGNSRKTNLPKSAVESGPSKKIHQTSLSLCRKCSDVYYKKSWHHEADFLNNIKIENPVLITTLCPADTMIENGLYEGILTIENVPEKFSDELFKLIQGFGKRSRGHDSQVRIIEIKREDKNMIVTTTENQLVVRLGKKIRDTFNSVDVKISYGDEPYQVARVRATFK